MALRGPPDRSSRSRAAKVPSALRFNAVERLPVKLTVSPPVGLVVELQPGTLHASVEFGPSLAPAAHGDPWHYDAEPAQAIPSWPDRACPSLCLRADHY